MHSTVTKQLPLRLLVKDNNQRKLNQCFIYQSLSQQKRSKCSDLLPRFMMFTLACSIRWGLILPSYFIPWRSKPFLSI